MSEEYAIPGFSKHSLIRGDDGTWTVVGASGRPMAGGPQRGDHPSRMFFALVEDATGRGRTMQLGRIVLLAMVGPNPAGTECCHKDGDPGNNDPANLYWGTRSQNTRDAMRHGVMNKAVLTTAQVDAIRSEYVPRRRGAQPGPKQPAPLPYSEKWLAAKYGVTQTTVHQIITGTYRPTDVHSG